VVVYTPKAKASLLGIPTDFIESCGTVGDAITREMAVRIREKMGSTWGLAVTGNAGPTADENASKEDGAERIGRCYIALAGPSGIDCQPHNVHGDRTDIQFRATNLAIDMLRRGILRLQD
jgi:nicotinamide-nucleotide amidase